MSPVLDRLADDVRPGQLAHRVLLVLLQPVVETQKHLVSLRGLGLVRCSTMRTPITVLHGGAAYRGRTVTPFKAPLLVFGWSSRNCLRAPSVRGSSPILRR